MLLDLVLGGCGVKGAAYAGAVAALDSALPGGLEVQKAAGTSAGAIVASLIACGVQPARLTDILFSADFSRFRDGRMLRLSWDFARHGGLYQGEALEQWLRGLIGDITLGSTRIPLSIVCFDMRNYETVVLSSVSHPDLPVARAARMSASIPLFFRSVSWRDTTAKVDREIVDGGVLENYPIELFDVAGEPRWPTFGLRMEEDSEPPRNLPCVPKGPEIAIKLFTAIRAAYAKRLSLHNYWRSVTVPDIGVASTDFALSDARKRQLHRVGAQAALAFLQRWNADGGFEGYKRQFRNLT